MNNPGSIGLTSK